MIMPEETAADRVRKFLKAHDPAPEGAVVSRVLTPTEGIDLTFADLETLIMQADTLRHYAEVAHMVIENGPTEGTCVEHLHAHVGQCYRRGLQDGHNQAAQAFITEAPL